MPQATGNRTTYNFCFTPSGNRSAISFRMVSPNSGFSALGLYNWVSTDGLFPPQVPGCLEVTAQGSTICTGACWTISALATNGVEPQLCMEQWLARRSRAAHGLPRHHHLHRDDRERRWLHGNGEVTVTDANGCSSTDAVTITVDPAPFVALGNDTLVCLGGGLTITTPGAVGTSWLWSTGEQTQSITVYADGNCSVVVSNGCGTATDAIRVTFEDCSCPVYIPNAFTPNADGINDTWWPVMCPVEEFELYIFDRWGEEILSSQQQNLGWNGEVDGTAVQEGVYVYLVKALLGPGDRRQFVGHITLLR